MGIFQGVREADCLSGAKVQQKVGVHLAGPAEPQQLLPHNQQPNLGNYGLNPHVIRLLC